MSFTSQLLKGEIIVDDDSPSHILNPEGVSRGLDLNLRGNAPYAYGVSADPFDPELLIPRSEWEYWIKDAEQTKTRLSDRIAAVKLPPKKQIEVNFCWSFGIVHPIEILYAQLHNKLVSLSATSVAAQVTGFRNVGGWGRDAVRWIAANGVVADKYWPENALNRKYATAANKERALQVRVENWTECQPRNLDQAVSLLLRRIPGGGGRMAWEHETADVEAIWLDGQVAIRTRNQWPGQAEWVVMRGNMLLADDWVFPRSVSAIGEAL